MNDYAIVVLSGFPDIFCQFCLSAERCELEARKILVASTAMPQPRGNWTMIETADPFSFPAAANIGIEAAGRADVFLVNDDVQFLQDYSVRRLAGIAHAHPEIGILSPIFEGRVGNRLQEACIYTKSREFLSQRGSLVESVQRLCFTGVYIRRAVIDQIGLLDERFSGYGCDDDDYCLRVRNAGLKLAVTPEVVMRHGFGAAQHSASFKRTPIYPPSGIDSRMVGEFMKKWGRKP